MKRILSFILVLSMLFSMTVYAESAQDGTHELDLWGYDRFIQVLSDIGVELPKLELTAPLKKGDFIKSLNSFFGLSKLVSGGSAAGSYADNLAVLYNRGWISEAEKNSFNEEEIITLSEASKYIINALGYSKKPEYSEDAEKAYVNDASSLEIYDGVTTGWNNPISSAQMLKMFYNTMLVNVFEQKNALSYGEGGAMLYEVHGVEILKGIVTADSKSALAGDVLGESYIEIDGVQYECNLTSENLVGMKAAAFIKDDVVLHILASENEILEVSNEDIVNFSNLKSLTYLDESDKERDIDFEYPPTVFVNGKLKVIESLLELETILGENGQLQAIDNDGDNKFEIVKITNYITYVVDKINYNKGIITDSHADKVIAFDLEKMDITIIRNGEAATFSDIKAKDVIEVSADSEYVNDDGERVFDLEKCEYIKIIVTGTTVGGIVNSVDDEYIEIDETQYELSDYFKNSVTAGKAEPITAGMSGAFYENHAGKIVYVNTAANAFDKYGFLAWSTYNDEEERVVFRIFTSENKMEFLSIADKVTVDGETKKNSEAFLKTEQLYSTIAGEQKVKNQLVIYRLNSDGQISYIDTALVTNESEDKETALSMDMEFYRNTEAKATDKMITSSSKYNGPGDVFTSYTTATDGRYSYVNIKPTSEVMFVVSGFTGETKKDMLTAHNNMQITEPLASSKNFEVTTAPAHFGSGSDKTFSSGDCVMFYNVGDDNSVQYIVFYDTALDPTTTQAATGSAAIAFYAGKGKAVSNNNEVTDYINVYVAGSNEKKQLICKDTNVLKNMTTTGMDNGGELVEGDIIRYALNADGEVSAIKRDVDFKKMVSELNAGTEPECFASASSTGIEVSNSNYDIVVRWLGTVGDSYFTLMAAQDRWSDLTISEAAQKPAYRSAFTKTNNVLIYDTVDETFSTGTVGDLFAAKECGESASVLYVRQTVSQPNLILAYNFMPQSE